MAPATVEGVTPVDADLIRWDAPGPYTVVFSTRAGGVSEGHFGSLNLGGHTDDDPAAVLENRRRLIGRLGGDPDVACTARQVHGARVVKARPTGLHPIGSDGVAALDECDGLWTNEPGRPLMLVAADCVPVALVRTGIVGDGGDTGAYQALPPADGDVPPVADRRPGSPASGPALALLHAGWRGLLAGIVEQGVRSLGGGPHPGAARLAACIGPAIGPCCYEVGDDVAGPFREAFGKDIAPEGRLDLHTAVERALRRAGVSRVHRIGLCTACNPHLFFSHRRDGGRTGRQGVVGLIG